MTSNSFHFFDLKMLTSVKIICVKGVWVFPCLVLNDLVIKRMEKGNIWWTCWKFQKYQTTHWNMSENFNKPFHFTSLHRMSPCSRAVKPMRWALARFLCTSRLNVLNSCPQFLMFSFIDFPSGLCTPRCESFCVRAPPVLVCRNFLPM